MRVLAGCREREEWEAALKIAWTAEDYLDMQGRHLSDLGIAYGALGQEKKAIGYYEKALVIQREIGDMQGEGNQLCNLGVDYWALGQVEKAIQYMKQSLSIFEAIKSPKADLARGWLEKLEKGE